MDPTVAGSMAAEVAASDLSSYVSTGLQTASTVLVAVLLCLLVRTIDRRYLRYWAGGWCALVVGLVALNLSFQVPGLTWPLLSIYWAGGDLFGFLLFAGCRCYSLDKGLEWRDGWLLIPPLILGVFLPARFVDISSLFPAHSLFIGGYCLLAFAATLSARATDTQTRIGLRFLQVGLVGIVVLFWHYSVVLGYRLLQGLPMRPGIGYLNYSAMYDTFIELILAFGQVLLVTDSARQALVSANRQLQAVSEQLALAARTDALTGLLNRRAFESMLADPLAGPAPGSLAAIDVNDLKPLNDVHGHTAGDGVLRTVARAVQNRTRIGDPVFRMGGDEFLVILPGVAAAELTKRLDDLDRALVGVRLPGMAQPVDIRVAWGVAEYRDRSDLQPAVDRADAAMYQQKQERKKESHRQAG
ncbi:MAG: GGDEF domain-containing protein [Gemmataceae bacterium]|nr:GGDEF domain-containing protein [Gemmataceae bacterium]